MPGPATESEPSRSVLLYHALHMQSPTKSGSQNRLQLGDRGQRVCIAKMLIRRNSHKIRKHLLSLARPSGTPGAGSWRIWFRFSADSRPGHFWLWQWLLIYERRRLSAAHQQRQSSAHPSSQATPGDGDGCRCCSTASAAGSLINY